MRTSEWWHVIGVAGAGVLLRRPACHGLPPRCHHHLCRQQRTLNSQVLKTSQCQYVTLKFLSGLSLAVQTLRQRLWSTDASSYESDARSEFLCHSTDQSSDNFILIIGANVVGVLTVLWLCKYFGIHVRFFLPIDRLNSENIWINLNKVETNEGNEYLHVWA